MKPGILIGIAGGTGSGKTSVAKSLTAKYGAPEVFLLEQDAYYKDLSHLPLNERAKNNFDHPDAIDFDRLKSDLEKLLRGESVAIPVYDFKTHSRSAKTLQVESHHILVLEGIFALYDKGIRDLMDIKIFVDTEDDIRFIRRLIRDIQERGRTLESVVDQYLNTVRPMHVQFVEPCKRYADVIIPEGGQNTVAVDLLQTKIDALLKS